MKHNTAEQLNVKVAHVEGSACYLSDYRVGLYQKIVKAFPILQAFLELFGLCLQLLVAELLDFRFKGVDFVNYGP